MYRVLLNVPLLTRPERRTPSEEGVVNGRDAVTETGTEGATDRDGGGTSEAIGRTVGKTDGGGARLVGVADAIVGGETGSTIVEGKTCASGAAGCRASPVKT